MATGGWGAMGGGAWGGAPAAPQHDDDDSPRAAPPPSQPTFGSSYNPSASYRAAPPASPTPAPVTAAPSFKNTPSFGGSSSNREAELRKKEAELEAREKRVAEAEKDLERTGVSLKKKNWPICFPIWRHDIGEDIPERSRRVVREAYLCWYLLILCLTYQFFCASVMLGYGVSNKVPSWFLSIIFWVMGVPLSIWLWYKRIYNAARDESSFGFISFFIFFFCHWAFCVFCAIAPQINAAQWCFSGFMTGFSAFEASAFAGTIYMIGGAAWGALALYSMWVLKDCWFFFRGQGGVQEVKQKAAQEAALAAFRSGMGGSNRV